MPQIIFLPHEDLCPDGAVIEADKGQSVLDVALKNDIDVEHACEKVCASLDFSELLFSGTFVGLCPVGGCPELFVACGGGCLPESRLLLHCMARCSSQSGVPGSDLLNGVPTQDPPTRG